MHNSILIPETLFDCIKHDLNTKLTRINLYSVRGKRQWLNYSPEKRAIACAKSSQRRLNMSKKAKAKAVVQMREGMKRYWKNVNEEKKKIHVAAMSKGMKKAWEEKEKFKFCFNKKKKVKNIYNVSRINTYSGVISESQMEEVT